MKSIRFFESEFKDQRIKGRGGVWICKVMGNSVEYITQVQSQTDLIWDKDLEDLKPLVHS